MDFSFSTEHTLLRDKTRAFIAEHIIPMESDPRQGPHGPEDSLRQALQDKARAEGLLALHVGPQYGGIGLNHVGKAVVLEEAGYSPLGPLALNVFAPDEGNMHLLEQVASEAQKEVYLRPLAAGRVRSCFCMTEPDPGAGSDPSMLQTQAVRDGDDFVITGRKWFITGAQGAAFAIIMAKGEDGRATMFLSPMDAPGISVERQMDSMDHCFPGGHCVVSFNKLRVPRSAILGEEGKGFEYAQIRLAPARLTHCMRWLGAVRRAHDIAVSYAQRRQAFGKTLGQHEGVGFMLADNVMDMHTARLSILHTAWTLDQGVLGLADSSMTKVVAAEAIYRVADRCVQILGGQGVTGETLVSRIFSDVRGFRIYDGPSEVHRWALAKRIIKGYPISTFPLV